MDITVHELKEKLEGVDEFVFVDVREPHEYEESNLGAQLRPLNDFVTSFDEYEEAKDKEIVLMCRSGVRSAMAQQYMKDAGFKNVRNLLGGILAWKEAFGA
ncbi:MAG: rhodanese-like domain-containing protein [Bacteroidia bacterium]|nr:rhodanese-like domain-containing protein [Bacteroidia bacterium]